MTGDGRLQAWRVWLVLAALACGAVHARGVDRAIAGEVVAVADGDTLTILAARQEIRVRLSEIDAPERRQAFGTVSRQHLAQLCFRKQAVVTAESTDRYGRVVGRVACAGVDANAAMVRAGLAWAYTRYMRDPRIAILEREARAARRGLWRDPAPIPPWSYRRGS